jgi:hypothetical protein
MRGEPETRRANPKILASVSEPERLRLAGGRRVPLRIWTFWASCGFFSTPLV